MVAEDKNEISLSPLSPLLPKNVDEDADDSIATEDRYKEVENEERKCWQVNKYMVSSKMSYFFNNAKYSINEYMILFYVSTGLNAGDAGILNAVQIIGGTIASPLWALLADRRQSHRSTASSLCIMALLTMSMQPLLGSVYGAKGSVCIHNGNTSYATKNIHIRGKGTQTEDLSILFYSLLVICFISSVFDGSVLTFVDSGVLHRVRKSPIPAVYGRQRLFGSLGYGLCSLLYSAAIQYFPEQIHFSCETGLFIVYGCLCCSVIINISFLYKNINISTQRDIKIQELWPLVFKVLKKIDSLFVFIAIFINGVFRGVWYGYLFIYLKELGASTMLLSYSLALSAMSGLTIFWLSHTLMKILGGPFGAMAFTSLMWALRYLCLVLLHDPIYILIVDVIHGLTKPLFQVAALVYIRNVTDPLILTTFCGINNALNNIGLVLASWIGGVIYKAFGGRKLFEYSMYLSLCWTFIMLSYALIKRVMRCYRKGDS